MHKLTIAFILTIFLLVTSFLILQPALAPPPDPVVYFTFFYSLSAGPPGSFYSTITNIYYIPLNQNIIRFETGRYLGADQNDRVEYFECRWSGGSLPTSTFQRGTCDANVSRESQQMALVPGGPLYWLITGSTGRDLAPSPTPYLFQVRVVNDDNVRSVPASRSFLLVQGCEQLDSACPTAMIYKANSYAGTPTGPQSQYHDPMAIPQYLTTQYSNMYLVFEGLYGNSKSRSDIFDPSYRTTFECKWDYERSFSPCGRFNILESVSPGFHYVDVRAKNANGVPGHHNSFGWCVLPYDCVPGAPRDNPSNYRPITMSDVRFISGASDISFYSGKNETISLKDVIEFPILNKTIDTNNTNATSFVLKDTEVLESSNKSLVKDNR